MGPINRVAVIGECMIELTRNNGTIHQSFGGDTLNTAVYLSRLTKQVTSVSYVTGLGKDPFSNDMLTAWQNEGLNTDMVFLSDDKLPGIYAIETTPDGERSFYYWRQDSAAKYWLREHPQQTVIQSLMDHQLIYLSGISLAILPPDCRRTLINMLSTCREQGTTIAFDNNYRPALWQNREEAQEWYQSILSITDIAFLTFDDEQLLWGDDDEQQCINRARGAGVAEIVIKRGAEDCFVITGEEQHAVAAVEVTKVIDTTAAGDSFSAGYLAKRISGGDCLESALAGHTVAGTVIQHKGAIIPDCAMSII